MNPTSTAKAHQRKLTPRRALAAATVLIASSLLPAAGVAQGAQGNWSAGCAAGWTCFWHGAAYGSEAVASTIADSDFTGDTYGSGHQLGDHVSSVQNRFVGSTHIGIYRDPSYFGYMGCAHPASHGHGPQIISGGGHGGNGVSAFKGISC